MRLKDILDDLKLGCISVLPAGDAGGLAPSLEKQRGAPAWKLSNEQLWTGSARNRILAT